MCLLQWSHGHQRAARAQQAAAQERGALEATFSARLEQQGEEHRRALAAKDDERAAAVAEAAATWRRQLDEAHTRFAEERAKLTAEGRRGVQDAAAEAAAKQAVRTTPPPPLQTMTAPSVIMVGESSDVRQAGARQAVARAPRGARGSGGGRRRRGARRPRCARGRHTRAHGRHGGGGGQARAAARGAGGGGGGAARRGRGGVPAAL